MTDTAELRRILAKTTELGLSLPGEPAWPIEEARRAAAKAFFGSERAKEWLPALLDELDRLRAGEAAAVAREREACSKVASLFWNFSYAARGESGEWDQPGSPFDRGQQRAAQTIAAIIRSRGGDE